MNQLQLQLRRLVRLEYGDSLETAARIPGDFPTVGSGGASGTHEFANTGGPVIVVGRKGSYGSLHWFDSPVFCIDTAYSIDQSCCKTDLRFMFYLLKTLRLSSGSQDVGVPGLSRRTAYELHVTQPPPREAQRQRSQQLDRECARIDELVAEQQRQLGLLDEHDRELVRALLTGAGTPGTRQQSGPYWLGSTPSHWRARKIAHEFRTGSGTTPASGDPAYYDGPHPWLVTGECRDEVVCQTSRTVTDRALADYSALGYHPAGSVVVAMYGATIGRLAILGVPMTVNQACCVLSQPRGGLEPEFAFWWFWAHRVHVLAQGTGGGQGNISQGFIRGLRLPAPPAEGQRQIVGDVQKARRRSEELRGEIQRNMALLQEHKQALITAVVTGQKDVA